MYAQMKPQFAASCASLAREGMTGPIEWWAGEDPRGKLVIAIRQCTRIAHASVASLDGADDIGGDRKATYEDMFPSWR